MFCVRSLCQYTNSGSGEGRDRTCETWFTRRVVNLLHHSSLLWGDQKNRLIKSLLFSTHTICFDKENF